MEVPFQNYLNQPLKIECADGRTIYGVLVCVSAPLSIILQNGICYQPSPINIQLQFHYVPQCASKPFLLNLDPKLKNCQENLLQANEKYNAETDNDKKQLYEQQIQEQQQLTQELKKLDQLFMKDKYYIGTLAIPGNQIKQIILLK